MKSGDRAPRRRQNRPLVSPSPIEGEGHLLAFPLKGEGWDGGVSPPVIRPVHGGIKPRELRALGLKPEDVLDFSASVSPIGPPAGIWAAMHRVDLTAYPDPQCLELREAISRHLSGRSSSPLMGAGPLPSFPLEGEGRSSSPWTEFIPSASSGQALSGAEGLRPALERSEGTGSEKDRDGGEIPPASSAGLEHILVGNGSTELIHLLARAYLSPPRPGTTNTAFLLTPTYGEYEGACRLARASVSCLEAAHSFERSRSAPIRDSGDSVPSPIDGESQACPEPGEILHAGFLWDLEEASHRIAVERPSLVFLCNPNNPTGVYLQQQEVEYLAVAAAGTGGLLVLDEAYINFVDQTWNSLGLLEWDNVVLLRSMTKDYALTGLRLGYSLASAEVTARLASWQPDWSVNGLAQAAGVVALADASYLPRARQAVAQSKEYLTAQLTALGFIVMPSAANFLMVQVGDAVALRDRLMRRGFFVRDCTSFGLPDHIRIGIRALPDCQRLVQAIKAVT